MSSSLGHDYAMRLLVGGARRRKRTTRARAPRRTRPMPVMAGMARRKRRVVKRGGLHPLLGLLLRHVAAPVLSHLANKIPIVRRFREKVGIGKRHKTTRGRGYNLAGTLDRGAPRMIHSVRVMSGRAKKRPTRRMMTLRQSIDPF